MSNNAVESENVGNTKDSREFKLTYTANSRFKLRISQNRK